MKDKLERLNTTYSRVEADLNAYVAATKKFEGNASEKLKVTRVQLKNVWRVLSSIYLHHYDCFMAEPLTINKKVRRSKNGKRCIC